MRWIKSGLFVRSAIVLFLLVWMPALAEAKPGIANISVNATENLITMDAVLTDAFTENILEAVESGVPMTFTFEIELRRKVSLFADKTVSRNRVHHTIQFDALKKTYQFTAEGKNVHRKVLTRDLENAKQLMLTLKDVPIAPVYKLDPDEKYYVAVKSELEADGLWFPFNYLLFFVPFNEFETDWEESSLLVFNPEEAFPVGATDPQQKGRPGKSTGVKSVIRSFNQ